MKREQRVFSSKENSMCKGPGVSEEYYKSKKAQVLSMATEQVHAQPVQDLTVIEESTLHSYPIGVSENMTNPKVLFKINIADIY